jgi:SAM-dependent methyltransferase
VTQVLKHELLKPFLSKEDRILDVGCGTGLFSLEMSRHGFQVEGIEPSGRLVEIGVKVLNVPIHHGLLEEFKPAHRYKGIFVWDVLEHVSNPVALVKQCHDLMEAGGYLFVQVPNYDGLSNRWKTFLCRRGLKKTDFKHFGFPWHIYAFNRKSMDSLLKTGGFEPLISESWSHLLKDDAQGLFSKLIIALSKKFCLSDYLTCVAQKRL